MKIIYILCLLLCMVNISFASVPNDVYVVDDAEVLTETDKEYVKNLSDELEHYTKDKIKLVVVKYVPENYTASGYADKIWKQEIGTNNILVLASMHEPVITISCTNNKFSLKQREALINNFSDKYLQQEDIPTALKNTVQEVVNELIERHIRTTNKNYQWWW